MLLEKEMKMNINYRHAVTTDLPAITKLLQQSQLPVSDIQPGVIEFFVAENAASEIVGCIGMEVYEPDALLRSFAVAETYRNQKIGSELLARLFENCQLKNIRSLHLLTTTAAQYFSNAGFVATARDHAPVTIQQTAEFSSICPASSLYMKMEALPPPAIIAG